MIPLGKQGLPLEEQKYVSLWKNGGFPLGEQGLPLKEQRVSIWENRDFSLGEQRVPSGRTGVPPGRKEVSL